jgi:hypothetical protein
LDLGGRAIHRRRQAGALRARIREEPGAQLPLLAARQRGDPARFARLALDERERLEAMTAMGLVLVTALAALFLAAGIRGENGLVYGALLVLAEVSHLAALAVLNRRS